MSDQPTSPESTEAPETKKRVRRTKAAPVATSEYAKPEAIEAPAKVASAPVVQEISVKVRVLENGLKVAGGVAARGRVLNLAKSQAVALQELGKVSIVGI